MNSYTMTSQDTAGIGAVLGFLLVVLLIGLVISAVISFLIWKPYKALPETYRQMPVNQVWLMLIPFFNLIWAFFIASKLPASFKQYFDERGVPEAEVGDCGKAVALWWAICSVVIIVPCLGVIAGLAALVLLILFIVKLFDMRKRIIAAGDAPAGA